MLTAMTDQPSYLALLSRITHAETDAECYLNAWAAATPSSDVRRIISTIALREGEHGKAFAKRISELGFEPAPCLESKTAERMPIAASTTLTDREKFEQLGFGKPADPANPDQYAAMFADPTIDIRTGELLGRYVSEERDSIRLFRSCYAELCAESEPAVSASTQCIEDRLTGIEQCLNQLVARLA